VPRIRGTLTAKSGRKQSETDPLTSLLLLGGLAACVILTLKIAEALELGSLLEVLLPLVMFFVLGAALVYLFKGFEFD
jgi:hypothetical protein